MWGHVGPVPCVNNPTKEGCTLEDLVAKKVLHRFQYIAPANVVKKTFDVTCSDYYKRIGL
jgi:metal-sulfur cluster biosynthetic enzyme